MVSTFADTVGARSYLTTTEDFGDVCTQDQCSQVQSVVKNKSCDAYGAYGSTGRTNPSNAKTMKVISEQVTVGPLISIPRTASIHH